MTPQELDEQVYDLVMYIAESEGEGGITSTKQLIRDSIEAICFEPNEDSEYPTLLDPDTIQANTKELLG